MAEFSTLEDLTPLEVEILRRTADLGMISYDATPTCDVDDSSASESCSSFGRTTKRRPFRAFFDLRLGQAVTKQTFGIAA
ncbi:unnamed protein product [Ixodes persulcatus]